jgi:F-type H+-transporting ATPase subunit delta
LIRQSIARSYAKGLFAAGVKDGRYKDYLGQMKEILEIVNKSPRIREALLLPLFEMDKRKELLSGFMSALEVSPPVAALMGLLLERNRMAYLVAIHDAYEQMVDDKEGRVKGTMYSAYPLPDDTKARIEEALGERLNKRVDLHIEEDKELIGGLKVIVGGMRIDGSVKRQLELLNESMMKE